MPNHTKDELTDYNDMLRKRRLSIVERKMELDNAKAVVKAVAKVLDEENFSLLRYIGEFNEDLPLLDGVQEEG